MITLTLIPRYKFAALTIGNAPTITYGYEEIEFALLWVIAKVKEYGLRAEVFEPTKRYVWVGDEQGVEFAQPVIRHETKKTILPKRKTIIPLFENLPTLPAVGRPLGKLTGKQAAYLTWIDTYARENGYPPAFDEIAAQFGVKQDTAYKLIVRLAERGWLTFTRFQERSIQIVKLPERETA